MLERGELVPGIYGKVTAPNAVTYMLVRSPRRIRRTPARPARPARRRSRSTREVAAARADDDRGQAAGRLGHRAPVRARSPSAASATGRSARRTTSTSCASAIRQHRPSRVRRGAARRRHRLERPDRVRVAARQRQQRDLLDGQAERRRDQRQLDRSARRSRSSRPSADTAGKPIAYRIGDGEWIRRDRRPRVPARAAAADCSAAASAGSMSISTARSWSRSRASIAGLRDDGVVGRQGHPDRDRHLPDVAQGVRGRHEGPQGRGSVLGRDRAVDAVLQPRARARAAHRVLARRVRRDAAATAA